MRKQRWARGAGMVVSAERRSRRCGVLYLHGGAYVVGSARAYLHFVGQVASRAKASA
jgi:acetyl esterase/lipase